MMSIVLGGVWLATSYVVWVWGSRRRGWSGVIAYGGGFVYAIASLAAVVWLGSKIVPSAQAEQLTTGPHVSAIRMEMIGGCVLRGVQDGKTLEQLTPLCECAFQAIATGMTLAEYGELEATAADAIGEMPQMQRLRPAFEACARDQ